MHHYHRTVLALTMTLSAIAVTRNAPAQPPTTELPPMLERNDQCYANTSGARPQPIPPPPPAAPPPPAPVPPPPPPAAPPPPVPAPPPIPPRQTSSAGTAERNNATISEVGTFGERRDGTTSLPPEQPTADPVIDWGGTIHLSNDDSMSLASAQRLLYALDREIPFSLDQIRPHELLNYFTFDTVQPMGEDLFAVSASAEATAEAQVSLALTIQGATPTRPPLDLTILVDRSGSMDAEGRMDYTKRALHRMARQLGPGDRIDIVLFDDQACAPLEHFVIGRDDSDILARTIERMQPRGSTDLDLGLREAYRIAKSHNEDAARSRRVIAFTDAILNTGDVNPHTVTEVGNALEQQGVRLTGVGVGREFRDDVLNMLTEKGKGAYVFLGSERVVDRLFGTGFAALVQTIALDVHFALNLPPSLGMTRFYGEESSTNAEDIQAVNFQAGNSQVFLQDLAVKGDQLQRGETISLDLSWDDPRTGQRRVQAYQTTIGRALDANPYNSRKARALIAWTDILYARAMGGNACGDAFDTYRHSLSGLEDDGEMAYVSALIRKWCDFAIAPTNGTTPVVTKIRLDSDRAFSEIALTCDDHRVVQALSGSDTVVRFETPPGHCDLTLYGTIPMITPVDIPQTGGDLRCVVRDGRVQCF